jgi:hypothetical protein
VRDLPLLRDLGCTLGERELAAQRERGRALAAHVIEVDRREDVLTVRFDADVDGALLRETIETERSCCSFLRIEHDPVARRVEIVAVREADRSALAELAALFAA